jgi:hypothetical protein
MLPKKLYRGDSDSDDRRKLRLFPPGSCYGCLRTGLSERGNGMEIFMALLTQSVKKHVEHGWDKSHFLSFSSDRSVATRYALRCENIEVELCDQVEWYTSIITLETERLHHQNKVEEGLYVCRFKSRPDSFRPLSVPHTLARRLSKIQNPDHEVLIIDLCSYLRAKAPDLQTCIESAYRDKEWLVLPLNRLVNGELSCVLDDGCISAFETFRLVR